MPEITRLSKNEQSVLRNLACQYIEYASLPVQHEKKQLWKALNHLQMVRPMVAIDQLPWHEMAIGNELDLVVKNPFWRSIENDLRQTLYKWRHLPADMVLDPVLAIPKAFSDSGFGIRIKEDIAILDKSNAIVGHAYHNQLKTEDDLVNLKTPVIRLDAMETNRRKSEAHQLFDGILPIRMSGIMTGFALWDRLTEWIGPADILYALVDQPKHLHAVMERFTSAAMSLVDQLEEQGLLDAECSTIHCSYDYNDELPKPGYDPDKPRPADCWTMGMAQIFSAVSPSMHEEFEINYVRRIFERFGLVYYGCCEQLHDRIDRVRLLPNVRKISCSPWCDVTIAASKIGRDYVLSNKPSPAYLAAETVNWQAIEQDLRQTRRVCAATGTPLEYILKDISTVNYQPQRLWDWNTLAMDIVGLA